MGCQGPTDYIGINTRDAVIVEPLLVTVTVNIPDVPKTDPGKVVTNGVPIGGIDTLVVDNDTAPFENIVKVAAPPLDTTTMVTQFTHAEFGIIKQAAGEVKSADASAMTKGPLVSNEEVMLPQSVFLSGGTGVTEENVSGMLGLDIIKSPSALVVTTVPRHPPLLSGVKQTPSLLCDDCVSSCADPCRSRAAPQRFLIAATSVDNFLACSSSLTISSPVFLLFSSDGLLLKAFNNLFSSALIK